MSRPCFSERAIIITVILPNNMKERESEFLKKEPRQETWFAETVNTEHSIQLFIQCQYYIPVLNYIPAAGA